MAKISQRKQKTNNAENNNVINTNNHHAAAGAATKVKRTRKSIPRDSPPKRSSIYRGVTRHRWTGRFEAHLWDKSCWNESQNKKGKQVYLGAYDDEDAAARAYDLAALKYWGPETILNFDASTYQEELQEMEGQSKEEYIGCLRRKSSGFSRGVSKYRGVARHHHNGRWEARIGRVFGNKYLYLGTYATQEEAATAYDLAAIEYRGLNAVTNFNLSRYIKWLRPNQAAGDTNTPIITNNQLLQIPNNVEEVISTPSNPNHLQSGFSFLHDHHQGSNNTVEVEPMLKPSRQSSNNNNGAMASSALGLLLQSSKFKEMLERTSTTTDYQVKLPEYEDNSTSRSFPDDIQTYFDCPQGSSSYAEGDDIIFGDLNTFTLPMFDGDLDV